MEDIFLLKKQENFLLSMNNLLNGSWKFLYSLHLSLSISMWMEKRSFIKNIYNKKNSFFMYTQNNYEMVKFSSSSCCCCSLPVADPDTLQKEMVNRKKGKEFYGHSRWQMLSPSPFFFFLLFRCLKKCLKSPLRPHTQIKVILTTIKKMCVKKIPQENQKNKKKI